MTAGQNWLLWRQPQDCQFLTWAAAVAAAAVLVQPGLGLAVLVQTALELVALVASIRSASVAANRHHCLMVVLAKPVTVVPVMAAAVAAAAAVGFPFPNVAACTHCS